MPLRRLALSSALLVAISAAAAAPAAPAHEGPAVKAGPCQTTVSGKRWLIAPRGLSCSNAKSVVEKLAQKRVSAAGFFPGTYAGMRCLSTSRTGTKPRYIACVTKNRSKSMVAFRQ